MLDQDTPQRNFLSLDFLPDLLRHILKIKTHDAELHHCYNGARGVIFPSIVEGFGLPIVESLWFGKKTFVSDTPIHREVGGDDCCYFGLEHPTSLVSEMLAWEEQFAAGSTPPRRERPLTTWSQCTCQVFEHCEQAAAERTTPQPIPSLHRAA